MIPSHLTLNQVSKIMLDSNVAFKLRYDSSQTSQKETLSEVYKQFSKERPLSELFNNIIDLEYDTNQLLQIADGNE